MSATMRQSLARYSGVVRRAAGPILVATDGRGAANAAVRVAGLLAERLGTRAEALAILEPVATYTPELLVAVPPGYDAQRRTEVRDAVRAQVYDVVGPEASWRVDAELGSPPQAIAGAADERDASFVVLGIGRHSPFDRLFGTETALRTLRATRRPVLAVAAGATALPRLAVAAVDFTPASVHAAEAALDALGDGGTLRLVHVKPYVNAAQPLLADWESAYMRRVDELFGRTVAMLHERRADVAIDTVVVTGDPADQVLAAAERDGADLVATGTHGAGVIERMFVGSVATALLRRATASVLACQEPSAVDVARIERRLLGTTETAEPTRWAALLADFTARNAGRRAQLEVDEPRIGAQVQERGYAFLGAAYDRRDARVELMLGDPAEMLRHVTRSIPRVTAVAVLAGADGRDATLKIEHGTGQTLLTFSE